MSHNISILLCLSRQNNYYLGNDYYFNIITLSNILIFNRTDIIDDIFKYGGNE